MPNIKSSKNGSIQDQRPKMLQDVEDKDGKSESSEGIVDHNVFNKKDPVAKTIKEDTKQ